MPYRLVFMGSDPIALPLLEHLRTQSAVPAELVGVFTQPDRPRGRGMKLQPNEIKQWATTHGIPLRQPEKCGPEDEAYLRAEGIDLVLVMAYGQLLRRSLIAVPPQGVVNFHASHLPKLRGASPIHTAIATSQPETGVSLMRIVPKMDAGPVCDVESFPIPPQAQAPEVIEKMAAACVPLLERNLGALCDGSAVFVEQNHSAATYCRKITKDDARLDFFQPAQRLHDHIRAFQPWPGAQLDLETQVLKIGSARIVPAIGGTPGTLFVEHSRVYVQCKDDALELLALQRQGGKMLPTSDFLRGYELPSGMQASSYAMGELVRSE
jgi:methionyl-tRNA formyltransferase